MGKQNLFIKATSIVVVILFFASAVKADFCYSTTYSNGSDKLRPLPVDERVETPQNGDLTRRGFLGRAAVGVAGLVGLNWLLGNGALSHVMAAAPQPAMTEKLSANTKRFVAVPCVKFVEGQKITGFGDFQNLHRSYVELPERIKGEEWRIARYGRVWTYDSALGGYAELANGDLAAARQTADGLIKLGKMEEARGFKGLWHFSYNTSGDTFIDPRGPFGANCWGLKFILACMLASDSHSHMAWANKNLDWINRRLKEYLFSQQVIDETDKRYGLFRFGLYNPDDLAKGDGMGYAVWQGNLNAQMEEVSIEHTADAIDVLRLVALVNQKFRSKKEAKFIQELNNRHNLVMQSLEKLWVGDHYVTGMSADGRLNRSVAVDNNTWVASAVLPYNEDRAWQCIEYTRDNIMTALKVKDLEGVSDEVKQKYGDREIAGLFFFKKGFRDSVITKPLGQEAEAMLQPEATYGFIHLLYQFSLQTKDPEKRKKAEELYTKLVTSMMQLQYIYGGLLPYATRSMPELFNTMPAMAANATAATVSLELLNNRLNPCFLGVTPPEGFKVEGRVTVKPAEPEKEMEKPTPAPKEELPPPPPAEEMKKEEKPAKEKVPEAAAKIKIEDVKVTPNSLEFKVKGAPKGAVATGWVKTDIWYIQPQAESNFEIAEGETITVDNPRGNFEKGKTMIIIYKSKEAFEKMNKDMLRDWEVEGKDIKEYILKAIIIGKDGTLNEVSMAEFMEKVKFAVINISGQVPQLAIDTYFIEAAEPISMPTPTLSTSPYVGMGFLVGGPRGAELGKTQEIPSPQLASYVNVKYEEERPIETMIAGTEAMKPVSAFAGLGAVVLNQTQIGQSI